MQYIHNFQSIIEFFVYLYFNCHPKAVILFNLALIYHQRAVTTGELQMYRAADQMYFKGLAILQSFPDYVDVDMAALRLSILNNRAHIRLSLGRGQSGDEVDAGEEIRAISCVLLNSGSQLPQLEADMINQFIINTLVSGPQCAPSA